MPEMLNPYRSIGQEHRYLPSERLRGMLFSFFSLPPISASLLPLSIAINDSRPRLMRDVFSLIPVNFDALESNLSSMFNVVRIISFRHGVCIILCISMHQLYAIVNGTLLSTPE